MLPDRLQAWVPIMFWRLKAVDCQTGETLGQQQVTAERKEKVLNALGKAAANLRGQLGESLATVQRFDASLAEVTTPSLEALQAYTQAGKAGREKGPEAGVVYFQRAIALDPNFARAYAAIGNTYESLSEMGRAAEYYTKAFELRDHASEREKLVIAGRYYQNVSGELDKAARTYEQVLQSYPRDVVVVDLANIYAAEGKYDEAIDVLHQSQKLVPDRVAVYSNLANDFMALQRFDEARQVIQQAQARKWENLTFHSALYALSFLKADTVGMAKQQEWFNGKPDVQHFGLSLASDTEAYAGYLNKARELTARAVDSAVQADSKENAAIWQENAAMREAAFGNVEEARRVAAAGLKLAPDRQDVQVEAALAYAMAGDTNPSAILGGGTEQSLSARHSSAVALAARDSGATRLESEEFLGCDRRSSRKPRRQLNMARSASWPTFPACLGPIFAGRDISRLEMPRPQPLSSRRSSITTASFGTAGQVCWRLWELPARMHCWPGSLRELMPMRRGSERSPPIKIS